MQYCAFVTRLFISSNNAFKVVIITDFGQRQKSAEDAEKTTDLPETSQVPFFFFFFFFVDVKKDLNLKRSKRIFLRENLKNKHRH